jgi:hypothetical protein
MEDSVEDVLQVYVMPATAVTAYVLVVPAQTAVDCPVIAEGCAGLLRATVSVLDAPTPQPFDAATVTAPDAVNPDVYKTFAMFDPCPDVTVAPAGTVHV